LSVARSVVSTDSRSGGPLQWQEASADKLPFPDGSFDVVYCQLGLQFFNGTISQPCSTTSRATSWPGSCVPPCAPMTLLRRLTWRSLPRALITSPSCTGHGFSQYKVARSRLNRLRFVTQDPQRTCARPNQCPFRRPIRSQRVASLLYAAMARLRSSYSSQGMRQRFPSAASSCSALADSPSTR
jgi:hypothetical protein